MNGNLADMRRNYADKKLLKKDLQSDPTVQFTLWFDEARVGGVLEPNAMSLSTVSAEGRPSLRTVLLKQFDEKGFVFFTNLESRKAREIEVNPRVALLFPWLALQRQVIIHGDAHKISAMETVAYFCSRPLESQLGAWASNQSSVLSSRAMLEMKWEEMKRKFADGHVPVPSFWGGFRVAPVEVEFWQGREHRLHDRFRYRRGANSWELARLAP